MKIAFFGAGQVGAPLATHLAEAGHQVMLVRTEHESSAPAPLLARSPNLSALDRDEALTQAEALFLAVPFPALEGLLGPLAEKLAGKIVVDCTNPVGAGLTHALRSERSGSQMVQQLLPSSSVVKAFSIYGFENLEEPAAVDARGGKPVMLFCGDDPEAKGRVAELIEECGFEALDVGGLVQALHLEHMTLLWVRLVRSGGHSPRLMWAALREPSA